jgi:hypothetical protein
MEDLLLCSSYLALGVPNWAVIHLPSSSFSAPLSGRKRISARGVSHFQSFTLLLFFFILLLLASFYRKYKKIVPFIVVTLLLLVHYVVP